MNRARQSRIFTLPLACSGSSLKWTLSGAAIVANAGSPVESNRRSPIFTIAKSQTIFNGSIDDLNTYEQNNADDEQQNASNLNNVAHR